jgi:hypothetical protein
MKGRMVGFMNRFGGWLVDWVGWFDDGNQSGGVNRSGALSFQPPSTCITLTHLLKERDGPEYALRVHGAGLARLHQDALGLLLRGV